MPKLSNIPANHDQNEFKVGDFVEVTGWTPSWTDVCGIITEIDNEYCYIALITDEPNHPLDHNGFRSAMLTRTSSDYELAVAALGEDYFA